MKKIFSLITFLTALFFNEVMSQTTGAAVTTIPANFTAVDQVKIIVDVSLVGNLVNKDPIYLWTWHPNDPAPGNGDWTNSSEGRKMVKEGPNKWSLTMKPVDFYAVMKNGVLEPLSPAELTEIKFLVKAKNGDGDAKTADIILKVAPLVFVPTAFRTFPSVAGQNEILKVYLDQTLVTDDITTQRMMPESVDITLFSTSGAQVGTVVNKPLQSLGNKLFSFPVVPRADFNIPAGVTINKMVVVYKGKILDVNGTPVAASSQPFEKLFDDLK
jgi:hypothetical protein